MTNPTIFNTLYGTPFVVELMQICPTYIKDFRKVIWIEYEKIIAGRVYQRYMRK